MSKALSLTAFFAIALSIAGLSCTQSKSKQSKETAKPLLTGADQTEKYFPYLQGKRVAMMVNQSSIIGDKPSVDVMLASGIKIVRIFGPEHGFRGNASNGAHVADEIDPKTGIPIISLYGEKRKPSAEDMKDVDVMLYDIQDVGVRFYTNINALRNIMETCAEYDKELLILDRPNPHAYMVDGPILDMKNKSGIGQFPIPIAHGMTVGEFAQMVNGEGWLEGKAAGKQCKLKIIPIANYTHDTPYVLKVNPSPNLNTPQSVMLYPSTCLFEGTNLNHGRGTMMPFTVMGAPSLKGKYDFSYEVKSIPGMSENPLYKDQVCYGLDLRNYDTEQLRKKRQINLGWMIELYNAYPDKEKFFGPGDPRQVGNIDRLAGVSEFKEQIKAGMSEEDIRKTWQPGLAEFKVKRAKYLLYP